MKKYYEAYDERYKTVHSLGELWFGEYPSPIVSEIITKYGIKKENGILEIGCGEGRDAIFLLKNGYDVTATDVSKQAIKRCKQFDKTYENNFKTLDFIEQKPSEKYSFIYAIAVLHMLVLQKDRKAFFDFIGSSLKEDGVALVTTMSDGETEFETDISKAFDKVERDFRGSKITVSNTSCKMVSDKTFKMEIISNGFKIIEFGHTEIKDHFSDLAYAVIKKNKS